MRKQPCDPVNVEYMIPQRVIAEVVGSSIQSVKKVRNGTRGKGGIGKAATIKFADKFLEDWMNQGIQRVKEIITPEN